MANSDLNAVLGGGPVPTAKTADTAPVIASNSLYPSGVPEPAGITKSEDANVKDGTNTDPTAGSGTDGEVIVWEGHYSPRNFIGRGIMFILIGALWTYMAIRSYNQNGRFDILTQIIGWGELLFMIWLGWRMLNARYSHFYKLTNRRLFVSTGIVRRRRDMMELLRVKDVFTRQLSLLERGLSLGTVVVVSHEKDAPIFYLPGVNDPKQVMDLIWHQARAERDQRSVKVDSI